MIKAGATTINLPDTVGYSHARRDRRSSSDAIRHPRAERRQGRLQHALPRRPRAGGRQQPGGRAGRRASGRVHDQRHRRARRQRLARRDRDGVRVRAGSAAVHHRHQTAAALRRQPAALRAHRPARAGEQGHRRPQRVRARGGHPPGRHAEGPPHLRNHAARGRRRRRDDAGARQALGPPRGRQEMRGAGNRPCRGSSSTASTGDGRARRHSKRVSDDDLRGIAERVRQAGTPAPATHPARPHRSSSTTGETAQA